MKKNPKPATAGENLVMKWYSDTGGIALEEMREAQCTRTAEARTLSWLIDDQRKNAVARAVKRERERCAGLVRAHHLEEITIGELEVLIACGTEYKS